ncbi:hypothetical protein ACKI16_29575 [Streptomyces scabiei]|uniref:hypothetical protein n=1 Tax=Streptomyces scabiei TaxID=1930 RepID=UPI0038F7165D
MTSTPIPTPRSLTNEERTLLARYEETPDSGKSREELIEELRLRGVRAEHDKYREAALIRRLLPDKEGPRGHFTEVAAAARYTREYVGRIRDGKVPTMNYAAPTGAE